MTGEPTWYRLRDQHDDLCPALWNRFFFGHIEEDRARGKVTLWTGRAEVNVRREFVLPLPPDLLAALERADYLLHSNLPRDYHETRLLNAGGSADSALRRLQQAAQDEGLKEDESVLHFADLDDLFAFLSDQQITTGKALADESRKRLRRLWNDLVRDALNLTQEEYRFFEA